MCDTTSRRLNVTRHSHENRSVAMWKILIILATGFLVTSAANPANIYRWRDARGVLNYSDTPPREGAREVVILRAPSQTGIGGHAAEAVTPREGPTQPSSGTTTASGAFSRGGTTTAVR